MKLAFIGTGRITDSHIISARRLDLPFPVEVLGFYGPREASRAAAAGKWGGRSFPSVEALLDARPDAVYVTSPTPYHAEQAIAVARAGIPLYLEKPATRTREEFVELRSEVERSGILACLGVQWRYRPQTRIVERLLRENPPTMVVGRWYWFTPPVRWLRQRTEGGGQVFDQQVHILDVTTHLIGGARSVFARFGQSPNPTYPDFDNWDVYALSLEYDGCIGSFTSTYRLNVPLDDRVLLDFVCSDLLVRYRPSGVEIVRPDKTEIIPETGDQGLDMVGRDAIEHAFLTAVHTGDRSEIISSLGDVAPTMDIVYAATESAESGRLVELGGWNGLRSARE